MKGSREKMEFTEYIVIGVNLLVSHTHPDHSMSIAESLA